MRTRNKILLNPRELGVLALARTLLHARGPMTDAALVELLEQNAIPAAAARACLLRSERAGHLHFDASGWDVPTNARPPVSLLVDGQA